MSTPSFGVATHYTDAFGVERELSERMRELLEARMATTNVLSGVEGGMPLVATPGRYHPELRGSLTLETGEHVLAEGVVESVGYHVLITPEGERRLVIAAPEWLPQPNRGWGVAAQLYATRSEESWGIGDFRDLGRIAALVAERGGSAVLVSPLHAMAPGAHQLNSPYSPSSRTHLNVLHIAPGAAPGAELVELADLARAGRALNRERRIDRDAVWALKQEALERIWGATREQLPPRFLRWRAAAGRELEDFCLWNALAEKHTSAWREWPTELSGPYAEGIEAARIEHEARISFHAWCQWVALEQLAAAGCAGAGLVLDLAVGFDSNGAEAWTNQDLACFEFEVGCPPDPHNREGQRWGLPPIDPHALVGDDLMAFRTMVANNLRSASALRMDHVMQLWRLFWIPVGESAELGAYVHEPVDALLAVIRVEAARAHAWIVGEDMGTVADGVRETMASIGMLGNRAALRTEASSNPENSVGVLSTHDQPTVAGLLTGKDRAAMAKIGKAHDHAAIEMARRSLAARAGINLDRRVGRAQIRAAILAQHHMLAVSPSRIVLATMDDLAGVVERPNMPGTTEEWPNWRIGLPASIEEIFHSELGRSVIEILARER